MRLAILGMAALLLVVTPMTAQAQIPAMYGRAAALVDGKTGQILFQQGGTDVNFPASTTKLLTALVAVERGHLDQVIKVSAKAVNQAPDSSSCYLNRGEEQTLENLLYGLLLVSGNDCAVAIAEGVANGNQEQFVAWMNETARRVGATHSNFANPHGLHESNHYTTAVDLAYIARAALANPVIQKISATREFNWPGKTNGTYYNHNNMLFTYDGTVGGKTGFTEEARLTLVNAARRRDLYLIGVVMGEDSKENQYGDMKNLLNWGFDSFGPQVVVAAGQAWGKVQVLSGKQNAVPVVTRESVTVTAAKGTEAKVTTVARLDASAKAPIASGQNLGTLEVRDGERLITSIEIVAAEAVPTFWPSVHTLLGWFLGVVKGLFYTFIGLLLFRTVVKAVRRVRRRARRRSVCGQRVAGGRAAQEMPAYRWRDR